MQDKRKCTRTLLDHLKYKSEKTVSPLRKKKELANKECVHPLEIHVMVYLFQCESKR